MLRNFKNELKEYFILAPLLLIISILTLPKKIYWKMKKRRDITVKWQRERAAYYHLPLAIQNTQVRLMRVTIGAIASHYLGKFIFEHYLNPKILQYGGTPIHFDGLETIPIYFLAYSAAKVNLIDDDDDNLVVYERSKTRYITEIKSLFGKKHQFSFENWRFQEEWNHDCGKLPNVILYLAPFSQKSRLLKDSGPHLSLQYKELKSICEILVNKKNYRNLPQFPKVIAELIAEYTLNPASLHLARNAKYYSSETSIRSPEALADLALKMFPIRKSSKKSIQSLLEDPNELEFEIEEEPSLELTKATKATKAVKSKPSDLDSKKHK